MIEISIFVLRLLHNLTYSLWCCNVPAPSSPCYMSTSCIVYYMYNLQYVICAPMIIRRVRAWPVQFSTKFSFCDRFNLKLSVLFYKYPPTLKWNCPFRPLKKFLDITTKMNDSTGRMRSRLTYSII